MDPHPAPTVWAVHTRSTAPPPLITLIYGLAVFLVKSLQLDFVFHPINSLCLFTEKCMVSACLLLFVSLFVNLSFGQNCYPYVPLSRQEFYCALVSPVSPPPNAHHDIEDALPLFPFLVSPSLGIRPPRDGASRGVSSLFLLSSELSLQNYFPHGSLCGRPSRAFCVCECPEHSLTLGCQLARCKIKVLLFLNK